MHKEQTLKGFIRAFAAFAAFAWSDASVKMIEGALSSYEMGFFGAVFGLAGLPFLLRRGDRMSDMLRTTNRPLWLLRFVPAAVGTIGTVVAFPYPPLAEAFALTFLLPSFLPTLPAPFP